MGIKRYRPVTPSRRWMTGYTFDEITKTQPEKSLLIPLKKTGGRNVYGRITVRHRGGGHKRRYRIIDFRRDKVEMPATVLSVEYDPNRTARIALVQYEDGEKRYILAPVGLKVGDTVINSRTQPVEVKPGNAMLLRFIPLGTILHNLEIYPGKGGQVARSAGTSVQLMAKEGKYAHVRMPSGEVRLFPQDCLASIGQVSNPEHDSIVIGKAGRMRWLGRRPTVRGVAMNPVDHPHGGGEGRAPQGNPHPVSPWGWNTKGKKTRKRKPSDKLIVRRRK